MAAETDRTTQLLIGGEHPFTTETIAEVPGTSPEQVNATVAAARKAWPVWARTPAEERCELGREGLEAFQETKHVHMETKIERKEWWYPYREYGAD